MSKILYCKNIPVYDLTTGMVYTRELLPGYMQKLPCKESFLKWIRFRYSTGTNTFARALRGLTFGQGNRERINESTYMLSLSDCYWVKDSENRIPFEAVSPYDTSFWTGEGEYPSGMAIPTLYVPGFLSKKWRPDGYLFKGGEPEKEMLAIEFCRRCGIPVEDGRLAEDGIEVKNFTSPDVMLEQANASGRMDEEDFTTDDILREFGFFGVQMITVDAILGNGDRHTGNFGFLRDTTTGTYLGPAPLYDFDHIFDSKKCQKPDILMEEVLTILAQDNEAYTGEILRICEFARTYPHEILAFRAHKILDTAKERALFLQREE